MAITHHFIVWLAAARANKRPRGNYALLGDDIVICDSDIAREYKLIMAELHVEISSVKTHESKDLFEFAKR